MPSRRRSNLNSRISAIPKADLGNRDPHKIVGTIKWAEHRAQVAFVEGRLEGNCVGGLSRNELYSGKSKVFTSQKEGVSTNFIDRVLDFIDQAEWAQIEGGEHNGRWINPKHYPERIFDTGRIKEMVTGEYYYFPHSSTDNDPKGLAFHYVVSDGGKRYTIKPNIWQEYKSRGHRKSERRNRQKKQREYRRQAREEEIEV